MFGGSLTRADLQRVRVQVAAKRALSSGHTVARITVHQGTCGLASGAGKVLEVMREELGNSGRSDVELTTSGCFGFCGQEPLLTVETLDGEPIIYGMVDEGRARTIFSEHVLGGRVPAELALARGLAVNEGPPPKRSDSPGLVPHVSELPFFSIQHSWVLRNRGLIDPGRIEEYIWRGGYEGAARALFDLSPTEVIEEVKASGLRGRGGGGFPTSRKWELCAAANGDERFILCNADEGDPGAFMDRSVLEGDPHAVLEGMIIGARAIGAHQGYIYCRAEYPLAVATLGRAIEQARERGLLGADILGSGFDLDIEVYQGAGAFVCGEETALMASIEGRRGNPRPRPPFPATSGLWQKPTVLNNVETYASLPQILVRGGAEYAKLGTATSKGTKVFALTGKVQNVGLVEVPMGTTLRQIIFLAGGGIPNGKRFKAAQLGGPSGGCLGKEHLDTPIDYEAIVSAGAIMGSGGLIVMDEETCMVDMARYFMDFCQDESCGKCAPCRAGTRLMLRVLDRICRGEGRPDDIDKLRAVAETVKQGSLCGLGQTAPGPVLSTLRYFRHEYQEHLAGYCPSGVCKRIAPAPCQRSCPIGMDVPSYNALLGWGRVEEALEVIHEDNPFPSICGRICPAPCEANCVRGETEEPVAIRAIKRFVADQAPAPKPAAAPSRAERIAVVGGGPCGLTAAHELVRRGYAVTVFEAREVAGGKLRHSVPDFRLPRQVVDREVARLAAAVDLRTGRALGLDFSLDDLFADGYAAVLLAIGAPEGVPYPLGDGTRVEDAAQFLEAVKAGCTALPGRRVAVFGAGYLALDTARTAVRLGAEQVVLVYPRHRRQIPFAASEVELAEQEGVRIECECVPVGAADGGLRCLRTRALPRDESGRERHLPLPGSDFTLACEALFAAVGHKPATRCLERERGIRRGLLDNLLVDTLTQETGRERVFAAGEVVTLGATVIEAIAAGQRAAAAIHGSLSGEGASRRFKWPRPRRRVELYEIDEEPVETPREAEPLLAADARRCGFDEAVQCYAVEAAEREARRCLRCDLD